VVSKSEYEFLGAAAALGALEWPGELRFLLRLPGSPFLLLLGAVCLALCDVLFLEPLQTSVGLKLFLLFLAAGYLPLRTASCACACVAHLPFSAFLS
jgi:hypothetical protein